MIDWENVEYYATQAKGIAFDGCHKIYVLMDYEQVEQMEKWGYGKDDSYLFTDKHLSAEDMNATLRGWYERSCGLRFIEATSTGTEETIFETLIGQGEDQDEEDEE